jgi:hypothetical protein
MGEMRKAYKILNEKPEGKTRGRPSRRIEDIRMDLKLRGYGLHLVQDRGYVVGCCEHGNEP